MTEKRRGYVTNVAVSKGTVLCEVEDVDVPNQTYTCPLVRPVTEQVVLPPVGSEVVVEKMRDEEWIVVGTLSTPGSSAGDEASMQNGSQDGYGSVSFVFGPREGASKTEKLAVEYRSDGYVINADVDGSVTINAGGKVTISSESGVVIDQGGEAKKVATEDHTHSYEGGTTGTPSDVTSTQIE